MGGIDGGWWTFTRENDYDTCPDCCGSGKDNATLDWKCPTCYGTGRVKIEYVKKKNRKDE